MLARAFGLKVLEVVRPAGDNGLVLILNSNELLLEIAQPRGAVSPGAEVIGNRHLTHGIFKVGFCVADLESAVTRLRAINANFETGIVDVAKLGFSFVLLRDPDGNYVQLFGALGS